MLREIALKQKHLISCLCNLTSYYILQQHILLPYALKSIKSKITLVSSLEQVDLWAYNLNNRFLIETLDCTVHLRAWTCWAKTKDYLLSNSWKKVRVDWFWMWDHRYSTMQYTFQVCWTFSLLGLFILEFNQFLQGISSRLKDTNFGTISGPHLLRSSSVVCLCAAQYLKPRRRNTSYCRSQAFIRWKFGFAFSKIFHQVS